MMAERQNLFDDDEPEPDLSKFKPAPPPPAPALEQVRSLAAAAGFPNRDPKPPEIKRADRGAPFGDRYYYRTGRDTQFNTKVRADVKAGFVAIAAEDRVPIGKVLEDALEALLAQRNKDS